MFRIFPVILLRLAAYPVALVYWIFSKTARDSSRFFLARAAACLKKEGKKFSPRVFRHILAFSLTVVEKKELNHHLDLRVISAGDIGPDTVILFQERLDQGGLVVIAGDRTPAKFFRHDMHVRKSEISFDCPRRERAGRVENLARSFAEYLEYYCKAASIPVV
jgi:predicted LPLAT superfamily acyltransferase